MKKIIERINELEGYLITYKNNIGKQLPISFAIYKGEDYWKEQFYKVQIEINKLKLEVRGL